jgi:hypothetical protein
VSFEVSLRARILADLKERRRLLDEARAVRCRLGVIAAQRRSYAAKAIAERHSVKLRQVNAIAGSICWGVHHSGDE